MIFDSGMMTHEESHVLHWLKNRTLCWTYTSVVRASVKGLAGTFIGRSFFWCHGISFRFGQVVSLLTEAIFSFNFWETASMVSLGEAKNGFIFGIKFWLRVWSQNLSFLEFVAGNSRLACVGSDRMRAE